MRRNPHDRSAAEAAPAGSPPLTLRIAFLRIDFANDRGGPLSTGTGRFDLSGPDTTVASIDRPPHNRDFYLAHLEALRRYYDAMSYGRVIVAGEVWPRSERDSAYTLNDMADYGPWAFSQDIYGAAVDLMRASFFAADAQAKARFNDPVPWDDYDAFMIIHAGGDLQSDLRQDSPEDIPSFTIGVLPEEAVIFPPDSTNIPIDRVCIVPETASQDGFYAALNGVIAHENGHNLFGFADLYDVFTGLPQVGYWSLMDSGNLAGAPFLLPDGTESFAVGLLPPSLDPFHRFFISDILPFTDVVDDTMSIADSQRNPDMRRLFLSSDEYLVIENRFIAPAVEIELDQDSTTRVVLGPKVPDRYEYDALLLDRPHPEGTPPLPSGGLLVWHIDASRIPFATATRIDPTREYGFNSTDGPDAVAVIEADGLDDLGDPSSPFIFQSPFDPYFRSNNAVLADDTTPALAANTGSRPHARIEVLDDPGSVMRFVVSRDWGVPGWPVTADFPPGGPQLLAVDADGGDRRLEVCWAGGADGSPDSTALFAVRADGTGLFGPPFAFANLDRRPRPLMAALQVGSSLPPEPPEGPAWFAVTTYYDPSADSLGGTPGGQLWLIDHTGLPLPGWPAALPSRPTTPPVFTGLYPNASVFVGCANGRVYELALDGSLRWASGAGIPGGVAGRLAVGRDHAAGADLIAAGGPNGDISVFGPRPIGGRGEIWTQRIWNGSAPHAVDGSPASETGFIPDFLWIDFDGAGSNGAGTTSCGGTGTPELVVHHADMLWAFCGVTGAVLPGWARSAGDTLVAGLGAGDPDGDGFPEVLTQTERSAVAFWNASGHPSPGWPRVPTRDGLRTRSPALAVDVDGDRRSEIVALDGGGLIAALRGDGRVPEGWPLATGALAAGSPVAADLDRDGTLEIVAPDRWVPDAFRDDANGRFGSLYAYTLPAVPPDPVGTAWPMIGGDAGRSSALAVERTPVAGAATPGPLVSGSLRAYPNPARQKPVSFSYQLTEPAEVEFSIRDAAGREVASFTRSGRRADNVEVWEPGGIPAGLYVAQLRFRGATTSTIRQVTLGLLR